MIPATSSCACAEIWDVNMEKEFWHERWEQNETGFHQVEINSHLLKFWKKLRLPRGSLVFVPMCGKSRDMLWLTGQGYRVLGVELSAIAVRAFFMDNRHTFQLMPGSKFDRYVADDACILCGDYFDLCRDDLTKVRAVYDRASLIAFPPEMRKRYVNHLATILPLATQILLVSFDYPRHEMDGPPFSVSPEEVEALYQEHAKIDLLEQIDVLEQSPRFRERGLSRLQESVFLLTMK
jgi:thiopurine S-methyltransferase